MKNLELENLGLVSMDSTEMQELNGGMILSIPGLFRGVLEFLVQEGADFVQGVGEGYNYVR